MPAPRSLFRPTIEGIEPRLLLSAARHPAAYSGTIRGEFKEAPSQPPGSVSFETYVMVKASGTLAPYGSVGISEGFAVDHGVEIGRNGVLFPFTNRQSVEFDEVRRGREVAGFELDGPAVPSGTPLQAGQYAATIFNADATNTLATRTATLTLSKGLPHRPDQLVPFTITFQA